MIALAVVLPLLIGLAVWWSTASGPTSTDSYIKDVQSRLGTAVSDLSRQPLIDAGTELCSSGISGERLEEGSEARAILAAHDLGSVYTDSWVYVSAAASKYLC